MSCGLVPFVRIFVSRLVREFLPSVPRRYIAGYFPHIADMAALHCIFAFSSYNTHKLHPPAFSTWPVAIVIRLEMAQMELSLFDLKPGMPARCYVSCYKVYWQGIDKRSGSARVQDCLIDGEPLTAESDCSME